MGLSKDDPVAYHVWTVQVEHQEGLHTRHEEVSDIQQRFPEYLLSQASSGMLSEIRIKLKSSDTGILPRDPSFPARYFSFHSAPCSFSRVFFSPLAALLLLSYEETR